VCPASRKMSASSGRTVSRRSFVLATTGAIGAAAALIALGRVGSTKVSFSPPPSTPGSPTTTLPSSAPTILATSKGLPDAPITIVVFSDFQCSHCQQFALTTEKQLEAAYFATGKARLVYKHFIVFGEESMLAAMASEAAAEQDMFWPYYDRLIQMRASPSVEDITIAKLEALAQDLGLNMPAFKDALESGKYREKVIQDTEDGKAMGVTGTPTFFVNGAKGTGEVPFEAFQQTIDQMLRGSAE
jgi:protein-disulfide isomerase